MGFGELKRIFFYWFSDFSLKKCDFKGTFKGIFKRIVDGIFDGFI